MLVRELKLKPTTRQKRRLNEWLFHLTGVYNWAIRKIEQDAHDRIYHSNFDFQNLLANHGSRIGIPSHTVQGILNQAYLAWQRCFKKVSKKPKLKSVRNKLNSIPFPDVIPQHRITDRTIRLPKLGWVRYHKQQLLEGVVKLGRVVKRASGWYLQLTIDAEHRFPVKDINRKVGIDTGFKHLAVLSDGTKFENQRNYCKAQKRLAQAQRGHKKQLVARLHERIRNRRKDNNHKISRRITENYSDIYITNDSLVNQTKLLGKSVGDAGISQLRQFLIYKSDVHSRKVVLVDSKYTTMTCSNCGFLTGPTGFSGLAVRTWECRTCGVLHDRNVNSARVILRFGLGWSLENAGTHAERLEISRLESSGGAR